MKSIKWSNIHKVRIPGDENNAWIHIGKKFNKSQAE